MTEDRLELVTSTALIVFAQYLNQSFSLVYLGSVTVQLVRAGTESHLFDLLSQNTFKLDLDHGQTKRTLKVGIRLGHTG